MRAIVVMAVVGMGCAAETKDPMYRIDRVDQDLEEACAIPGVQIIPDPHYLRVTHGGQALRVLGCETPDLCHGVFFSDLRLTATGYQSIALWNHPTYPPEAPGCVLGHEVYSATIDEQTLTFEVRSSSRTFPPDEVDCAPGTIAEVQDTFSCEFHERWTATRD